MTNIAKNITTLVESSMAKRPINILEAALECDSDDAACKLIQDALGIADGGVAAYSLPKQWPDNRHDRAACLAEWLSNELKFTV